MMARRNRKRARPALQERARRAYITRLKNQLAAAQKLATDTALDRESRLRAMARSYEADEATYRSLIHAALLCNLRAMVKGDPVTGEVLANVEYAHRDPFHPTVARASEQGLDLRRAFDCLANGQPPWLKPGERATAHGSAHRDAMRRTDDVHHLFERLAHALSRAIIERAMADIKEARLHG